MIRPIHKLLHQCPKKVRKAIARTATACHCLYWGHQAVEAALSPVTPLYAGLFLLTILGHYYHVEHVNDE